MKLCTYVVRVDIGLAPNPFWGYCTLAVCTPNHLRIRFDSGDWIAGFTPVAEDSRLVYAMQVSEVLHFNTYFQDRRFSRKKPNVAGTWRQRVGDNMYHLDDSGRWKQHQSIHHRSSSQNDQDLKHPFVNIARQFFYFGEEAVPIPARFDRLVWRRHGAKYRHDPAVSAAFIQWIQAKHETGRHGEPAHNSERLEC